MESWVQDPVLLNGLERLIWLLAVCPAVYLALLLSRWMAPAAQGGGRIPSFLKPKWSRRPD